MSASNSAKSLHLSLKSERLSLRRTVSLIRYRPPDKARRRLARNLAESSLSSTQTAAAETSSARYLSAASPFIARWLLTKSSAPTRQRLPRRSLKRPLTQRSPLPKNFSSRSRISMASAGSRAPMKSRLHNRGDVGSVSPAIAPRPLLILCRIGSKTRQNLIRRVPIFWSAAARADSRVHIRVQPISLEGLKVRIPSPPAPSQQRRSSP